MQESITPNGRHSAFQFCYQCVQSSPTTAGASDVPSLEQQADTIISPITTQRFITANFSELPTELTLL
jgi:hypothetical protein